MTNQWAPTKFIKEGNLHIMLYDYVYDRDRSPYYAELININHIRFTEAFNTLITVVIDIQLYYGEWIVEYNVYNEGTLIECKKITSLSIETIELIAIVFDRLTIDKKVLYKDDDYTITVSVKNLSSPPLLVVRDRHRKLLGSFDIDNLLSASSIDEVRGSDNPTVCEFVYNWSRRAATIEDVGNYFINNARRAFLTANWIVLQQINNSRLLPHEIE